LGPMGSDWVISHTAVFDIIKLPLMPKIIIFSYGVSKIKAKMCAGPTSTVWVSAVLDHPVCAV